MTPHPPIGDVKVERSSRWLVTIGTSLVIGAAITCVTSSAVAQPPKDPPVGTQVPAGQPSGEGAPDGEDPDGAKKPEGDGEDDPAEGEEGGEDDPTKKRKPKESPPTEKPSDPVEVMPDMAPDEDYSVEDRQGVPREAAPDLREGHIFLTGRAALLVPAGSIDAIVGASDVLGLGPTFGGTLGVGLGRHGVLDANAMYGLFDSTRRCPECEASMLRVGLGLTYHIAQSMALDPWLRFGAGYRNVAVETNQALTGDLEGFASGTYHGLDVAQFAFGTNFFPLQSLGFGPYAELDVGTFLARPEGASGAAPYVFFSTGLEIALDPASWFLSTKTTTRAASAQPGHH